MARTPTIPTELGMPLTASDRRDRRIGVRNYALDVIRLAPALEGDIRPGFEPFKRDDDVLSHIGQRVVIFHNQSKAVPVNDSQKDGEQEVFRLGRIVRVTEQPGLLRARRLQALDEEFLYIRAGSEMDAPDINSAAIDPDKDKAFFRPIGPKLQGTLSNLDTDPRFIEFGYRLALMGEALNFAVPGALRDIKTEVLANPGS